MRGTVNDVVVKVGHNTDGTDTWAAKAEATSVTSLTLNEHLKHFLDTMN